MVCYLQNDYLPTLPMTPPVVEVNVILYMTDYSSLTVLFSVCTPHKHSSSLKYVSIKRITLPKFTSYYMCCFLCIKYAKICIPFC